MSSPSLAFSVAFMSISVSTPNPFCASASRVRWTASSKDVCTVVDIAMVMAGTFLVLPGLWSVDHGPVHTVGNRRCWSAAADDIEFGEHAGPVVPSDVAEQFVAAGGQGDGRPARGCRQDPVTVIGAATARRLGE